MENRHSRQGIIGGNNGSDARLQTIANVDGTGARTSYIYDAAGQQTAIKNARGYLSTTVYDAAGQTIASVDALSKRTTLA